MPALAAPPAPAPAAAPAPAPKSSPAPAPEPKPDAGAPPPDKGDITDQFAADLDELSSQHDDQGKPKLPPAKAPAKPDAAAQPAAKTDDAPKPGDKPADAAAAVTDPPEPTKLNDLRSAYSTLKKRVKEELEPKVQHAAALESRIKELETSNPPEVKVLQERLSAAEKRRDELEQHIHYVDYSKSKEYTEKYVKPYQDAWQDALGDLAELTVEKEDGTQRQATQQDLLELANLPMGQARARANALFGDSADDMMAHRRKILDLSKAQTKALEDAKTQGVEKAKLSETAARTARETTHKLWTEANAAVAQRWPAMFAPVDGDAEGNALLAKGTAMADRLFAPASPEDVARLNSEGKVTEAQEAAQRLRPANQQEAVELHALIRHKIANHDRLALRLKTAHTKIKELEAELGKFEAGEPHGGNGGGPVSGSRTEGMIDDMAEIEALNVKGLR